MQNWRCVAVCPMWSHTASGVFMLCHACASKYQCINLRMRGELSRNESNPTTLAVFTGLKLETNTTIKNWAKIERISDLGTL